MDNAVFQRIMHTSTSTYASPVNLVAKQKVKTLSHSLMLTHFQFRVFAQKLLHIFTRQLQQLTV